MSIFESNGYMIFSSSSKYQSIVTPAVDLTPYTKMCFIVEDVPTVFPAYTNSLAISVSDYDNYNELGTGWGSREGTLTINMDTSLIPADECIIRISARVWKDDGTTKPAPVKFIKIWFE